MLLWIHIVERKTKIKVMKNQKKDFIKIDGQKIPDPKQHQTISFIKSAIRIIGYAFIPYSLETATILLILSEIVGIIEELV